MSELPTGATPEPVATPPVPAQGTPEPTPAPGTPPADGEKMVPLAALHEERNTTKSLKDEIEGLKQALYTQPQQPQYPQQPQMQQQQYPQNPMQNQQVVLEEMWEEDPRKAMQTEVMMALNWYDKANATVDQQEAQAAKSHPDFDTYRNEVRSYIRSLPVNERANPGMVESAYYFVKGRYADDHAKTREAELLAKMKAGQYAAGIPYSAPAPAAPAQATMEEAQMAANMGLSIEDYMKGKV